jgi:cytidylate kinase
VTNSAALGHEAIAGAAGEPQGRPAPRRPGLVIAVDGPAGSGKSSAARGAACALGLRYLDTGAMYRALTWWLLRHKVDISRPDAIAEQASRPVIEIGTDPVSPQILVDGIDVVAPIRTRQITNAVSAVAGVPQVRIHLIGLQRQAIAQAVAAGDGIVAEGRDIGTVVAPDAPVKVFLTASEKVRASRRSGDLAADPGATVAVTLAEQARRDAADAPQMARAADAVEIDTTGLGLAEVIAEIAALADARTAGSWPT